MPRIASLLIVFTFLFSSMTGKEGNQTGVKEQNQVSISKTMELVSQQGGATYTLAIDGNLIYYGVGTRLRVSDITDPHRLVQIGELDLLLGSVTDIQIVGDFAYVAVGKGKLLILDIINPRAMIEIGSVSSEGQIYDLQISRNYIFTANEREMLVFDISNPANPVQVTSYNIGRDLRVVKVNGKLLYATDQDNGDLIIMDISNPIQPVKIVSFRFMGFAE